MAGIIYTPPMTRFEDLIGQAAVKRNLNFLYEGWKATGRMPNLLLSAPKGTGKTEFAKRFSRKLTGKDGKPRPFVEINCGVLKKASDFFEIIYPEKILDRDVTVLFDECHALPADLETAFLTLFSVNTSKRATLATTEGSEVEFDFERQTFLFATTETNKVFEPLRSRLDEITFDFYSDLEMGAILCSYMNITTDRATRATIVNTLRGVARNAVKTAEKLNMYAASRKVGNIGPKEWADLSKLVGILPWGLTPIEMKILETLQTRGSTSLQGLCAATGMSRAALLYSGENGLLGMGFLDKDGSSKRVITAKGIGAYREATEVRKNWG